MNVQITDVQMCKFFMKRKLQVAFFILIALICVILILYTQPPFRNQVPIIWAFYGFVFHMVIYAVVQRKLYHTLIQDYKNLLDACGIRYFILFGRPKIDLFRILKSKLLFESVDQTTKGYIKTMKLNLIFALIGFSLIAVFGILTVVMTWKNNPREG